MMNMALTPLAATMETVTCNWTASVFTTMKLLVGTSYLFSTGNIKCLLVKGNVQPRKYTYRYIISLQIHNLQTKKYNIQTNPNVGGVFSGCLF